MSILLWIVFGLLVGAIAKLLLPGDDPGGFLMTIVIGIIGSFLGGGISYLLLGAQGPYEPSGWIMSIIGAIVLLLAYRFLARRSLD